MRNRLAEHQSGRPWPVSETARNSWTTHGLFGSNFASLFISTLSSHWYATRWRTSYRPVEVLDKNAHNSYPHGILWSKFAHLYISTFLETGMENVLWSIQTSIIWNVHISWRVLQNFWSGVVDFEGHQFSCKLTRARWFWFLTQQICVLGFFHDCTLVI